MSALPTCFENIIGLSRINCPCLEQLGIDATLSASGLYLAELPGLNLRMIDASRDCGESSLMTKMVTARENAIERIKTELAACINANTSPAKQIGTSQIGDDQKATAESHALNNTYHGLTLQTAKMKGGYFRVTAIATAFKPDSLPATITVNVYQRREKDIAALGTYILPCTGNQVVWTELPDTLELSMDELGSENPRYWFTYQPVAGMRAMNSLISCGCNGFSPYWDTHNPQYLSAQQKGGKKWAEWAMAAGTTGDDLLERDQWVVENVSHGLLLRVQFECDEMSTFCSDNPNYRTDNIQKAIAHSVQAAAGSALITDLLMSTDINPYTMTAGDQLEKNRDIYEVSIGKWVNGYTEGGVFRPGYLCSELSNPDNVNRYGDCRKCKDRHGMRKVGIFA